MHAGDTRALAPPLRFIVQGMDVPPVSPDDGRLFGAVEFMLSLMPKRGAVVCGTGLCAGGET